MAKKKSNSLKKPIQFSVGTVVLFVAAFLLVGSYALWSSFAAKAPVGSCIYTATSTGGVVSATNLPNDTVVNFFMKDNTSGSQSGWVLGITHDGTWNVNVPVPTHSTTYDFTGRTFGKDGTKYNIYAECTQNI